VVASSLSRLSNLARNILYLSLSLDISGASKSVSHDFLRSCTELDSLTLPARALESCEHVSIPLRQLSLHGCQPPHVTALLGILSSKNTVALSKLHRLTLRIKPVEGRTIRETVFTWDRWSEVEKVCKERKIELRLEVC
jgi:hypothetical protein